MGNMPSTINANTKNHPSQGGTGSKGSGGSGEIE